MPIYIAETKTIVFTMYLAGKDVDIYVASQTINALTSSLSGMQNDNNWSEKSRDGYIQLATQAQFGKITTFYWL